jgi:hypothetical protein
VIPKYHGEKLVDIPDDQLGEILPVVKKLAAASGAEAFNVLQNNGRLAHQEVDHVSHLEDLSLARDSVITKCADLIMSMTGSFPYDTKARLGAGSRDWLASYQTRNE